MRRKFLVRKGHRKGLKLLDISGEAVGEGAGMSCTEIPPGGEKPSNECGPSGLTWYPCVKKDHKCLFPASSVVAMAT